MAEPNWALRLLFGLMGEFRYPLRLRGHYLAKALPPGFRPHRIWDAGCGEGHTSFYLARRFPTAQILGTDVRRAAVERCQRIARELHLSNVHFDCADLADMAGAAREGFDLIVCFEVLEYMADIDGTVRLLATALAGGGRTLIHTPAVGRFQSEDYGLRPYLDYGRPTERKRDPSRLRVGLEPSALTAAVAMAGLLVTRVQYTFGPLAMFAHTAYELTRRRSRLWQAVAFPLLMPLGWLDARRSWREGGGLLLEAQTA